MKRRLAVVGLSLLFGCGPSQPSCPNVPELLPAAGTGTPQGGTLVASAQAQAITITPARDFLDYRFTLDGVTYVARYALSRDLPPVGNTYLFVRRPAPPPACGTMVGQGPVIDAIEVRRGGRTVSYGGTAFEASSRCSGQSWGSKVPSSLDGAPDGVGVPLGDTAYGWQLTNKVVLQSGDEVVVTVLDTAGLEFEVFAGSQEFQTTALVSLGRLQGTGTLVVP